MRSREKGLKTCRGAWSSGQSTEQAGSLLLARPENWDQWITGWLISFSPTPHDFIWHWCLQLHSGACLKECPRVGLTVSVLFCLKWTQFFHFLTPGEVFFFRYLLMVIVVQHTAQQKHLSTSNKRHKFTCVYTVKKKNEVEIKNKNIRE